MRKLHVSKETYPILLTALVQGGLATKDAKVAKRTLRAFKEAGTKDEKSPIGYILENEADIYLEEREFEFLKARFNAVTDWMAGVIEFVADAEELLETTPEAKIERA